MKGIGFLAVAVAFGVVMGVYGFGPSRMGSSSSIDRHFIEQMIPHHDGAIAMAELALQRSKRPEILSLSRGIIEAQTRENKNMREWYQAWFGKAIPDTNGDDGHMMHMEGMEGDLDVLKAAPNFDREFLNQMIVHHEMAIMMARMLAGGTERSEMKELADDIMTSQEREIEMMTSWRQAWFK